MSTLDLKKLKRRKPSEVSEQPKRKVDRFDGLSEEEVQKYTLEDYLEMNLDLVFVGINPSLMAAHRGRYYAGPGNHFYKLLHESGLTPRFLSFEEDYKLLQYSIGLTNIVTRPTRSAADLKRTEIKEGAKIVEEKLKLYKPKIAVFNGKCIYEVFANIRANKDKFHFGLQPERIDDSAIWVTPSSSARCANFPRMVDKLHFYTALKKYLHFLKGEIADVDIKEFQFEGKCKQSVPSTSKMWRRKNISTFLHGGRVVNKNTLCLDTSEEDIAAIHTAEFLVQKANHSMIKHNKDEDNCDQENRNQAFNKIAGKTEEKIEKMEKIIASSGVNDEIMVVDESKTKSSDVNGKESNHVINTVLNHENAARHDDEKCASFTYKTVKTRNIKNNNRSDSLDFMSLIKQKLAQKSNNIDITVNTSELKPS